MPGTHVVEPSAPARTATAAPSGRRRVVLRVCRRVWADERLVVGVAAGAAGFSGLGVALAMPRGPTTAGEAIAVMVVGLVVGGVVGLALGSRWALLFAPVVHMAVFEVGRVSAVGPTVDPIGLGSSGEVIAAVLGRGVHGLLGLVPMALGAVLGAGLARRLAAGPPRATGARRLGLLLRRGTATLVGVALVAAAVVIAWPASTPPILGPDGAPLPGSVAELATVRLGGHDQDVMVRGHSVDYPVLLDLAGGPGGSDLAFVRTLLGDLEEDFVVVGWDQRGAGKSYDALEPTATLTLDQAVSDTIELAEHLRTRFDEDKIYVHGESWGSTLGVLAVQRRPDLFHAYVGSGQMVDQLETDRRLYDEALAHAARTGDEVMAAAMEQVGEPPFEQMSGSALDLAAQLEKLETPYTPPAEYVERAGANGIMGVGAREYALLDKVGVFRGAYDMFSVLYPQLQGELDLRRDAPTLDVPVYLLDGRHELAARRDLALEWFARLDAPRKRRFVLDSGGHAAAFQHAGEVHRILTEVVLPETYPPATGRELS